MMSANNLNDLFNQNLMLLKDTTVERLGEMLNGPKVLTTTDGKLRDWRGVADFLNLDSADRSKVETSHNHTREIIKVWSRRSPKNSTVRDLIDCLKSLDRWDIVEDINPLLLRDCTAAQNIFVTDLNSEAFSQTLTINDVDAIARGKPLPRYNAMVLFSDEDMEFGMHVVQRMEMAGLRVFVAERDKVVGTSEHASSVELIQERCDKVVAIFSPSFVRSNENLFLINFAQHIAIQNNTNKIIPIIYQECDLPTQYKMYHKLVYKRPTAIFNFWEKLLVKTFELSNVSPEMKDYTFPTDGDKTTNSSENLKSFDKNFSRKVTVDTLSTVATVDTLVSEKSDLPLLPSPPTHEPSEDDQHMKAKKTGLKKYLKQKFSVKMKAKS